MKDLEEFSPVCEMSKTSDGKTVFRCFLKSKKCRKFVTEWHSNMKNALEELNILIGGDE